MRFKKGTKVEVLTQKEVPSGSWHCAEIIGVNGRSYTVRYDGDTNFFGKAMVERVPRKAIRPSPPPVDVLQKWVPGDVVEVFHNFSWKMATILKVSGRNDYLVRLLGSATELRASKYDVRARLCWQDGEWIVIGKASHKCEDLRFRFPSSRNNDQSQKMDTFLSGNMKSVRNPTKTSNIVQDSQAMPLITLKRKLSHCNPQVEAYGGPNKTIRVGKRENKWNQFDAIQRTQLPEKVENVASSREVLHENCMHRTLKNKINGCSEMIVARENTDGAVGYSQSISLESNDDHSASSSVASCSSVYRFSSHILHPVFTTGQFEDNDSECSDAESFCNLASKEGQGNVLESGELMESIHRLELHAYRCTIGALYASGPLSWEQELLLTNLRDSLHISNEEHLMEIRNRVSSSTCIPSS